MSCCGPVVPGAASGWLSGWVSGWVSDMFALPSGRGRHSGKVQRRAMGVTIDPGPDIPPRTSGLNCTGRIRVGMPGPRLFRRRLAATRMNAVQRGDGRTEATLSDGTRIPVTVVGSGPAILLPARTEPFDESAASTLRAWG